MVATKLPGIAQATGMRQHVDLHIHPVGMAGYTLHLVTHHQPLLQTLVMGGDPRRTGVLITLQRLDAARENMKPRAVTVKSAPIHSAQATLAEVTSLPEAITLM